MMETPPGIRAMKTLILILAIKFILFVMVSRTQTNGQSLMSLGLKMEPISTKPVSEFLEPHLKGSRDILPNGTETLLTLIII